MIFDFFKNIILAQNKVLLTSVAREFHRNESVLLDKYLKPEYYLPVVVKTVHTESSMNDTHPRREKQQRAHKKTKDNSDCGDR